MNIGIDIDGTINNLQEVIIPYAQIWNLSHGNGIRPVDPDARYNKDIFGWTDDETRAFKKKYIDKIAPQASLKPFVREVLDSLRQSGDKIYFITARDRDWDKYTDPYGITVSYLEKHNISYDGLIAECRDKLAACKEYNIDVLIEDTLKTCQTILPHGIRPILIAAPYNKDCGEIERVFSWVEVHYLLKGYLKEWV